MRVLAVMLLASPFSEANDKRATRPIQYSRDILPLLSKRCFECHGPDSQESGLRLDNRPAALQLPRSRRPAIVPGRSNQSRLIDVITGRDKKVSMPPDGERLTADEVATLREWIDRGASFDTSPIETHNANGERRPSGANAGRPILQRATERIARGNQRVPADARDTTRIPGADFWSFRPVRHVIPPSSDASFPANPIDAFVVASLQSHKLEPSAAADRRSLIRRLYLDVLGLPPSFERIEDFIRSSDPLAWPKLVDQVLASPHYGERWARHWLDVVRFAETDGFETNVERPNAWQYRDYVIRAFNNDIPYGRFICEQLAGDASGEDAATGFLVGGACDRVKSPDVVLTRMQRQDELTDMINTTGTTFLGLTLGCAKCHDHKFDPIPQHDFYAMQAVFAGVKHGERPLRCGHLAQPAPMVYAGQFEPAPEVRRLFRGDPMLPREVVGPGGVAVVGALVIPRTASEQERRVALANWIASAQNPLTARVMVNRLWHYHFGCGIVSTPSDFGHNGGIPSHPELLDWLAGELVRSGGSLKHIHRLILTSATYRQSSHPHPDGLKRDATCRLLWRFPPRRLEAEAIRDSVLAVSGCLDFRMGGPGFSAFEPNNNYVRVYRPKQDFGPAEWRRMIYMSKVRMEQDGVFGVFDCPDAGLIAPRRSQSTTPLQALNLFNSRFTVQQAESAAARVKLNSDSTIDQQCTDAFDLVIGRAPDPIERAAASRLIETHGLVALCRALFNSNEFLFLP